MKKLLIIITILAAFASHALAQSYVGIFSTYNKQWRTTATTVAPELLHLDSLARNGGIPVYIVNVDTTITTARVILTSRDVDSAEVISVPAKAIIIAGQGRFGNYIPLTGFYNYNVFDRAFIVQSYEQKGIPASASLITPEMLLGIATRTMEVYFNGTVYLLEYAE